MAKAKAKSANMPMTGGPSMAEQRRWQAEDDVRTLQRAAEIQQDRGRLTRAQKHAKTQAQLLSRVAGPKGKR